jgi:hypothetical protein
MDTQTLAEKLVANILDNDEDGAKETYAMLLGRWRQGEPIPDIGEAVRRIWKGRKEAAERNRSPFGTALIGSRAPPVTFSVDALDTIIRRRQ